MILVWLPVIGWMGAIFYVSGIPHLNSGLGVWDLILRKLAHMFEYAVLTGLLFRAIHRTWSKLSFGEMARWSFLISFVYAISDEIHQAFVPGRGPSFKDVLFDSLGILFLIFVSKICKVTTRHPRNS
jgi:VanZ family protein